MRTISNETISQAVAQLCIRACCVLTDDLLASFEAGQAAEESPVGREIFRVMLENAKVAREEGIPACQDTGMAVIFAEVGQDLHIDGDFEAAVNEGVRRGYVGGKLRLSVVGDPLRRVNTNDNTPAVLHTRLVAGDKLTLTVAPKGFGSENMSGMRMFKPSATQEELVDFIVGVASDAALQPLSADGGRRGPGRHGGDGGAVRQARADTGDREPQPGRAVCAAGGAGPGAHQPPGHRPPGPGRARQRPGCAYRAVRDPHCGPSLRGQHGLPYHAPRDGGVVMNPVGICELFTDRFQ